MKHKPVRQVSERVDESDNSEDDIYIPYVTIAAVRSQHKVTNLKVNKTRNVKFIIDSGGECYGPVWFIGV